MHPLIPRIVLIHRDCHKLCKLAVNKYLPVAGNVGIFCQDEEEYELFTDWQFKKCEERVSPDQKYLKLLDPITVNTRNHLPIVTYTHLYIRVPDPSPYGKNLGDIDFVLDEDEYSQLKKSVEVDKDVTGARVFDRPGWDTIQLTDPNISSVAYISTQGFAEKVRVKFE